MTIKRIKRAACLYAAFAIICTQNAYALANDPRPNPGAALPATLGSDCIAPYKLPLPNESGQIMVLMYHGLDKEKPSANYMRTVEGFKADLQALYDNGFRTIPVSDLIHNTIKVKAGYSPVLITFDDGLSSAFSLVEKDGKLVPAEDCAVDIMNKFAEKHPDFGRSAVFFINGKGRPPFFGKGTLADRFGYLVENGYDIGNHTYSHAHLGKLNAEQIQAELAKLELLVADNVPGYKMQCAAYPYGERPPAKLRNYMLKGEYDGTSYSYGLVFRAALSGMTATPNNKNYDPVNMPRVRGTDNDVTDLGWQFKRFESHPELKYISDGDPFTISVPADNVQNLDTASLFGRVLNVFDE